MDRLSGIVWHQADGEEALEKLESRAGVGLTQAEAAARLRRFGPNEVPVRRRPGPLRRLLRQFHQPLIYLLLFAAALSLALGGWVDAAVILGVVFGNAGIGYFQESKAETMIASLSGLIATETSVCREGRKRRVPSGEVVPGDLVHLEAGDRVPADLRLLAARNLEIEESAITGESVPVPKGCGPLPGELLLAERTNLAFAGTLVTRGRGEGVVFATGGGTEMGRIAALLGEIEPLQTPLTRQIARFSRVLLVSILLLALLTFGVGVARGEPWPAMVMAAVALAVGATPEGLPAALTITLAIGGRRMARRRAIVRSLPAVEALGSTTVICSDKTGTLTRNEMTVREIYAGGRLYQVSGTGYEPVGEIHGGPPAAAENAALIETLGAGLLCNDSRLVREGGRFGALGDPTEVALIVAALKGGLSEPQWSARLPRLDTLPFESETRCMATLHGVGTGAGMIYVKGAVEALLKKCSHALGEDGAPVRLDAEAVRAEADDMAARGLRVLAFARREVPAGHVGLEHRQIAAGLTFLGLQGKLDPPRPEAVAAVAECLRAGIRVKMITGDHRLTALAVARQVGLEEGEALEAMSGRELARLDDAALARAAMRAQVFARVTPEEKIRLVKALQAQGEIVAMTGDGVNDAPALRQADIGVAMGAAGTDVAREAADIVLADDNFASIEAAVEEGRSVFDNLTKFIVWTLPTNLGEGLLIVAAILAGAALPILPVQILWINMTTAILLGLMLVFEPPEPDLMRRPPRDPARPILTPRLQGRVGLVSLAILAGCFFLFSWELRRGATLAEARTAAANALVMIEIAYLFNCRSFTRPALKTGLFSNPWVLLGSAAMLALQLYFTYGAWANALFHTAPIGREAWGRIIVIALASLAAVEVEKALANRNP